MVFDNLTFPLEEYLMKRNYTMILVLTVMVTLLFSVNAFAVSVSDVKGSSLTKDQKVEIYTLMKTDKAAAETKFEEYSLDLELKAIADEATAEIHAAWNDTLLTIDRDECVAWSEAVDTERDDRVDYLTKRWVKSSKFEEPGDKATTDEKVELLKKQIDERKLNAKINGAVSGFKSDLAKANGRINRLIRVANSHETRLTDAEKNLETIRVAVNDNDFDLEAALSVLTHVKISDDVRDDSQKAVNLAKRTMRRYDEKVGPFEVSTDNDDK